MECPETRKFCRSLEAQGALTYPIVASRYAPPGWPDRRVCHTIWCGWLEFKAFNGRVKAQQVEVLRELNARNDPAYVLRFSVNWHLFQIESWNGDVLSDWEVWSSFFYTIRNLNA